MKRWLTWPKIVLYAATLLGFASWYVPQISADRYREPILAALENALGRKVEIGQVKFQLLPTPGFTISDVNIGEDPAVGPEPMAYVTTLRARPTISSLLGGPLTFASVDLEDAYINFTRVEREPGNVRWNFSSLMRPKLLAAFPSVHLISGRVNFKFGDTKSIFYLLDTDVDLWPPSSADGPWTLRMRAEPARTDRPARGFGSFVARGEWHPHDSSVTLDVKLERSELGDMVTLFEGRESGLLGHIWGDAHLAGPVSHVGLAGRLMVNDIHGWNQTPPGGSAWPLAVGGVINVPGQVVEIRATTEGKQSPVDLRYRVADYLRRPRWGVTAIFSQLPMSPLVGIARNLGWPIPQDLQYDGIAQGAVGYSMPDNTPRMDGEVMVANSTLAAGSAPPLRVASADLRFSGSAITLTPSVVSNDKNETATLEGNYDTISGKLNASLSSEGMSIPSLRQQISVAGAPLLGQATAGTWSGHLHYASPDTAGDQPWTGEIHLKDTDIPFEAFAQPLHILAADAAIDGAGAAMKRLSFSIGGIQGQGDYRYDAPAPRPHKFHISITQAEGSDIEKTLMPTLQRGNLLNYALNFGRLPVPAWLRAMRADGTVQIGGLTLGGIVLTNLKTRVVWDGAAVRFAHLQASAGDASFSGGATANLSRRWPQYQINGELAGLPWRSGAMNAEGSLSTSGIGADLLSNMTAKGSFRGRQIDLAPLDTYDTIDSCFEWAWDARNPKLKLTQLVMTNGDETFVGSAETQENGQLLVRVSDGTKQIQAAGAVLRGDPLKPVTQ